MNDQTDTAPREPDIRADGYRMIRFPEVQEAVRLSRAMIYLLMSQGRFPAAIKLGSHSVAWRVSEIAEWLEHRANNARYEYRRRDPAAKAKAK
jgi:prophage regulatory protein